MGAAYTLGDFTTDQTLVERINAFVAKVGVTQSAETVNTSRTEEQQWVDYITLLTRFVPLLDRYAYHPILGPEAQALKPLVLRETDRAGAALNALGVQLRYYGQTPRYGYSPGVGVRVL